MFALPAYIVGLGLGSGLAGAFARRFLAEQGLAPTFAAGVYATIVAGLAYAIVQVAYAALLRAVKPTRDPAPLLFEALSNAAALCLLPYLAALDIPWPVSGRTLENLRKVEPLVFLAAFAGLHGFFKLLSLFAATQSRKAARFGALAWFAALALMLPALDLAFRRWQHAIDSARVTTLPDLEAAQAGDVFAPARRVPEGLGVPIDAAAHRGRDLLLRWSQPADLADAPKRIYVTLRGAGAETPLARQAVDLESGGWIEMRVPAAALETAGPCTLSWSAEEDPVWVAYSGLRPAALSNRQAVLSGPWWAAPINAGDAPAMVVLLIEGLGADHVGHLGHTRGTTPAIDALAREGYSFRNAYTPAPEAAAAAVSLLTGRSPLAHGFLGRQHGPLPADAPHLPALLEAQGYATCAFTEGNAPGDADLVYGTGIERGFQLFDAAYPTAKGGRKGGAALPEALIPAGSGITLEKAAAWIEAHAANKFFAFVRLRELRAPQWLERYGQGFVSGTSSPPPIDIYDTAVLDVDKQIGLFLERLRALPAWPRTAVVVASSNGFDFEGAWRTHFQRRLSEATVRVPLVLRVPGAPRREPGGLAVLEEVAPTLALLAGAAWPGPGARDLLGPAERAEAVSMFGDPLVLSVRTPAWRFAWNTGVAPFGRARKAPARAVDLIEMARYRAGLYPLADTLRREAGLVEQLAADLQAYLDANVYPAP